MKLSHLATILSAAVCCVTSSTFADAPRDRVVAIYFHRTQRCPTCLKMGSYAEEAIRTGFGRQIKDGKVAFRYGDFQDAANRRVVEGYGIHGPALVLARIVGDKVAEWKKLDEIWSHVGNKESFLAYVQRQTASYTQKTALSAPR